MSPITTVERTLELRIHDRDAVTPSDLTVDFTLAHSRFASLPSFGHQIVRPRDGRTETSPFWLDVVDVAGEFTAQLAENGRMALLGRIAELRIATDGGAFATVEYRRLSNLVGGAEARYRLELSDERWIERRIFLFERTTSTQFHPYGQAVDYMGRVAIGQVPFVVFAAEGDPDPDESGGVLDANTVVLMDGRGGVNHVHPDLVALLQGDARQTIDTTTGGFEHLRFEDDSLVDHPVLEFDRHHGFPGPLGRYLLAFRSTPSEEPLAHPQYWWRVYVHWPSHGLSAGDVVDGRLHWIAPGIPTTEKTPYLVGGLNGIRAPEFYRGIAEGQHGEPAQIHSDAAFDALEALVYPPAWYRITERQPRDQWVDANLNQPYGGIAFTNGIGELAPRSLRPLENVDPDTLYTFDLSNATLLPSWRNPGSEAITEVVLEAAFRLPFLNLTIPFTRRRRHDTWELLGLRTTTITTDAIFEYFDLAGVFEGLCEDIFERFGDGPQRGELEGLIENDAPIPGDPVLLDHDQLNGPNPATGARSGKRVVHILERERVYDGNRGFYRYTYLDAGPNSQPLASPTISVSQNVGTPKHLVDVAVSDVPAGATAIIQVAHGASPQAADWLTARVGVGNETITIPNRPSGTLISVRAIATSPNRIRSAPSTVDSVTTASLTAPSAVTATATNRSVKVEATLGETNYQVEYFIDDVSQVILGAGSSQHTFHSLPAGTFDFGVRHRDIWGGVSTTTEDTETTGDPVPAPDIAGFSADVGVLNDDVNEDFVDPIEGQAPESPVVALLRVLASDPAFDIAIERTPDVSGSPQLSAGMLSHSGLTAFNPDRIVDRDVLSQGWHTDSATAGAWLKVDLGAGRARAMRRLGIHAADASYAGLYDVQYSDNDADWTTVADDFAPDQAGWNWVSWPADGAHRFWRLLLANTPGSGSWLMELDLSDGVEIARVPGATRLVEDQRPQDGSTWWYRAQHVRVNWQDGLPTRWDAVTFADLDDQPRRRLDPVGDDDVLRLRRDTIFDDGDYALQSANAQGTAIRPEAGVEEGGTLHKIYRHREEITVQGPDADGDVAVTFAQTYQNVPMILLKGGQYVGFSNVLGTSVKQRLRLQVLNATPSGFTSRAQIVAPGTPTSQSDDFASGNAIDAVGETAEVNLDPGAANDDSYTVHYFVQVSATQGEVGGPTVSASLVVAIDTNDGGGWMERATFQYGVSTDETGSGSASWSHEAKPIVVSGLGLNDDIRLRARSFFVQGGGDPSGEFLVRGGDAGGANPETYNGVTYTTASDTVESAIPAAGDHVTWAAQEVI